MKVTKGESQRVYWQQWLSSKSKTANGHTSRRELITSSAAIRINPDAARAKDVTKLLRDTLNLSSLESTNINNDRPSVGLLGEYSHSDALVLVGTLYSLPKDYIQFEHEPPPRQKSDFSSPNGGSIISSSSDPVHVIKTLQPDDNPLATRDKMMEHLKRMLDQVPTSSSTIAPKVQWYFVPSSVDPTRSPIPSSIDLDGYSTSMEEEEYDDDDTESDDDPNFLATDETDTIEQDYYDLDLLLSRCSLAAEGSNTDNTHMTTLKRKEISRQMKEVQRYTQLSQVQPSSVGYLLKRSNIDPHVWRKVYCVLTDDHLFYTTRIPYPSSRNLTFPSMPSVYPRMGKRHGRISLGQALLLEPNSEVPSSPLYRIPNSFEVVNSRGTSHIFRANNRATQRQWIQALSTKIMQSFENSLVAHAELIVTDESNARNKRFTTLAVEPLFSPAEADNDDANTSMYLSLIQASVLRLGLDFAEYRERCRQVQALLPARQHVIVRSTESASPRHTTLHKGNGAAPNTQSHHHLTDPLDEQLHVQVQACWDLATRLFHRATQVALEVQQFTNRGTGIPPGALPSQQQSQPSLSRSLETICRHVDYVITGQRRPVNATAAALQGNGNASANGSTMRSSTQNGNHGRLDVQSPPPLDLFDLLLSELQGLVHATPTRRNISAENGDTNTCTM